MHAGQNKLELVNIFLAIFIIYFTSKTFSSFVASSVIYAKVFIISHKFRSEKARNNYANFCMGTSLRESIVLC